MLIAKNKSGQLTFCRGCKKYQLVFNNILLVFNQVEFKHFKKFLITVDIDYWTHEMNSVDLKRQIPIPSTQKNLILMFNPEEILMLRSMLGGRNPNPASLTAAEIDYDFFLN